MKITKEDYRKKVAARDAAKLAYDAALKSLAVAQKNLNDANIAVPFIPDPLLAWLNSTESDTIEWSD